MLPPSFQNTLLALEEKLRRIQTLDRTVRQAATLEEETVAYRMAEQLAEARGLDKEFELLKRVERLAPEEFYEVKGDKKPICANVDFYSGFVYKMLRLPPELEQPFALRGYYGTLSHNIKGVYTYYLGWFDGNAARLNPLPPSRAAEKYVEYMGGAREVLKRARADYAEGNYRWVAQVLDHVVSADPSDREARELEARGVKELIVIAQDITRYGWDLKDGTSLAGLLKELCRLDFHWIRLHYLYPEAITDELISVIASQPRILHYLDIPIQHANDGILKAMRRRNTRAELEALFAKLRAAMPDVVIRTSLICGLPGEGEAEFEELCQFLREQKLQRAGVFQFSPEEGTLAAVMDNQVDPETAARRVELVVDLQSRIMDEYNEARLGTVMEVLCEGFDAQAGCFAGRTYADSVEIDGRVLFTAAGAVPAGSFVNVRITGVSDGELTGEIEE